MAARGLPSNVCAEQVMVALLEAHPVGLSTKQIAAVTDLTTSQIRRGLAYIREHLAGEHNAPLIWTWKDGYRLAKEPADLEDLVRFELGQFHAEVTRMTRFVKGTIDPHSARFPSDWITDSLDILTGALKAMKTLALRGGPVSPHTP